VLAQSELAEEQNMIAGPSWDVIAKDIRARIASGEYAPGEPIPSTTRLMEQYGVSKGPVRQAVEALRTEGLLAGRPGKAVYVTGAPVTGEEGAVPTWARRFVEDIAVLKADVAEIKQARGDGRAARKRERGNEQSG
jgi:GntR family transcriptional regulator